MDNDNDPGREGSAAPALDAHGQAAMLLLESLIHGLIDRNVIAVGEAVEIVTVALDARASIADDDGEGRAARLGARDILEMLNLSLKSDLAGD